MSGDDGFKYHRDYRPGRSPGQPWSPPPIPPDAHSFVMTRYNIEPGQKVEIHGKECDWAFSAYFSATNFVYVGSAGLWVLRRSNVCSQTLFGTDIPCESFTPGCPTSIAWPIFGCFDNVDLLLEIENRGKEVGHFVARLAGKYENC